jgi:cysteine desulfurase
MHSEIIYLDNNATTALDRNVLEAMMPYLTNEYANAASSTHSLGWGAKAAVELSRKKVSDLLECEENEIIFTSGASESIFIALTAAYNAYKVNGSKIISCKTEHKAVLNVLDYLSTLGAEIMYLDVDRQGLIDLNQLKSEINANTILICLQLCNNETGVVQPMEEISEMAHSKGIIVFSDATQAPGKMIFNINDLGIDLMPISAHKIYGPKGAGALYIRRKNPRVSLLPFVKGNQERDLRNGTYNTPAIVGLGEACLLVKENLWSDVSRISKLRTKLEHHLTEDNFGFINGSVKNRICNTTNLHFPGIKASELLKKTREIAYSLGSACNSSSPLPSFVLTAMGLTKAEAEASIRLSLGRSTSEQHIDKAIEQIRKAVVDLKS